MRFRVVAGAMLASAFAVGCSREPVPSRTDEGATRSAEAPVAPKAGPPGREPESPLVTLVDYLTTGETRARRYLETATDPEARSLGEIVSKARDAVVRIRVNYGRTPTSYQTEHGTGFLIDGGRRVITAGHVLVALGTDRAAEVVLVTTNGSVLKAKAVDWAFSGQAGQGADFGVLDVVDDGGDRRLALPTGKPRPGALVAVLGFPGRMGRGAAGTVVGDDHQKNNPLSPLLFVGRIRAGAAVVIEPVAGCVPEGGMSGGPVLDAEGNAVAVETSVTRVQSGEDLSFIINGVSLEGAAADPSAPRAIVPKVK